MLYSFQILRKWKNRNEDEKGENAGSGGTQNERKIHFNVFSLPGNLWT